MPLRSLLHVPSLLLFTGLASLAACDDDDSEATPPPVPSTTTSTSGSTGGASTVGSGGAGGSTSSTSGGGGSMPGNACLSGASEDDWYYEVLQPAGTSLSFGGCEYGEGDAIPDPLICNTNIKLCEAFSTIQTLNEETLDRGELSDAVEGHQVVIEGSRFDAWLCRGSTVVDSISVDNAPGMSETVRLRGGNQVLAEPVEYRVSLTSPEGPLLLLSVDLHRSGQDPYNILSTGGETGNEEFTIYRCLYGNGSLSWPDTPDGVSLYVQQFPANGEMATIRVEEADGTLVLEETLTAPSAVTQQTFCAGSCN